MTQFWRKKRFNRKKEFLRCIQKKKKNSLHVFSNTKKMNHNFVRNSVGRKSFPIDKFLSRVTKKFVRRFFFFCKYQGNEEQFWENEDSVERGNLPIATSSFGSFSFPLLSLRLEHYKNRSLAVHDNRADNRNLVERRRV